jgi:hypothetical protein
VFLNYSDYEGVHLVEMKELKTRMLKLLREDEEFRYAVAGLIGLEEILKRLDGHDAKFVEILKRLDGHDAKFVEILKRLDGHEAELVRLREDMNMGFKLVNRHISALGARWGLMAEEAFREGLRSLLEKELGFKVERWRAYDESGIVFGYPSDVEIDITVRDEKLILVEVSSHVRASDIFQFRRKAELYQKKTGRKPDRLLVVTPYMDEKAVEASERLGIEVYTKV